MRPLKVLFFILFLVNIFQAQVFAWDFSKHRIPISEIYSGGPPKDGIPALTDPEFVRANKSNFLSSDDRVLGIFLHGEAKAYPLKILNWHEIANDIVGGKAVVITYCPLTGSGIAFDANIKAKRVIFGVSGKLYNSNVLLYDRDMESLWSQLKMEAVTGKMTGTKLKPLPLLNTTWQDWRKRYPHTKVLSNTTGHIRDYNRDPYQGYQLSERLYFPVSDRSTKLSTKEWILGVIIDGRAKAYPFKKIFRLSSPLTDRIGGKEVFIYFDKEAQSAWVESPQGEVIPSIQVFWFAWYAFYSEKKVF